MRNSPTTTKSYQTKSRPTRQLACIISSMSKPHRKTSSLPPDDTLYHIKQRKPVPHEFVLDAISALLPHTRPMFGCLAVYVRDKIVLILRDKRENTKDNGVWLATTEQHHESLRREFPNMRSIRVLGKAVTGWQVIPAGAEDFEEAALRACDLVLAGGSAGCRGRGGHLWIGGRKAPESLKGRRSPPRAPRKVARSRSFATGRKRNIHRV